MTKKIFTTILLLLAVSSISEGKDKKKHVPRGMLESMQSVPCGAKERGLTGLGSVFGSVGVQHVNSHEQLCPQYLFRTDEMDYHIRPVDMKHAVVLPVGHEAQFRIKKNRLVLRPDGSKEAREYEVISMEPLNTAANFENGSYRPADKTVESRPPVAERAKDADGGKSQTDGPPQQKK